MSDAPGREPVLYLEVPDFYAEVERRRVHGLDRRAVLVGGDPAKRGKVQAASIEARRQGARAGMLMGEALALCPDAVRIPTDMPHYREAQGELEVCLRRRVEALEPAGYGAAYVEGSGAQTGPRARAEALVAVVREDVGLPLCVGIGPSKLVARLAARQSGEAGVVEVPLQAVEAFLAAQPVSLLPRVGRKAEQRLLALGAETIGDVVELGAELLERELGPRGRAIVALARGEESGPPRASRHPRTLSRGETLDEATLAVDVLDACLARLSRSVERLLVRRGLLARRVALRVRFADESLVTRSTTLGEPVDRAAAIHSGAAGLLDRARAGDLAVRGLALTVAGLVGRGEPDRQLELFTEPTH